MKRFVLLILLLSSLTSVSFAEEPATTRPVDRLNAVIEELNLPDASLGDLAKHLQGTTGCNIVLGQNVSPSLHLPPLRLTAVTLMQVFQVLEQVVPGLKCDTGAASSDNGRPVVIFKMAQSDDLPTPPLVRVWSLEFATDGLNEQGVKPALANVLSLVKAALDEASSSSEAPVLKVHEETRTLLFKGTAEQCDAIQQALTALRPSEPAAKAKQDVRDAESLMIENTKRAADQVAQLRDQMRSLQAQLNTTQEESLTRATEIERLKVRLEAAGEKNPFVPSK